MVQEWQVDLEDHIHLEDQAHDVAIKGVASTKRDLDTRMANLARLSEEFYRYCRYGFPNVSTLKDIVSYGNAVKAERARVEAAEKLSVHRQLGKLEKLQSALAAKFSVLNGPDVKAPVD
ncbi:hypothetical protein B5807_03213 [Epicoccum nigrum]|uniref:Uncharacterized protein n=1 Tax=Epicoccum nigrum TaxID=105696 RepID=A0A1Y2M8B4_EPING|nr:hypothetical protein B5807_03213 [Epicoccum nigrum]